MFKFELKPILLALGISVAVFGLVTLISTRTNLLEGMEKRLSDFYFFLREPSPPDASGGERNKFVSDRVQLVAIDSPSINQIGRWPWYRDAHARYIDNIYQFSPHALHLDIAFDLMQWDMRSPNTRALRNTLEVDPKALGAVEKAFLGMDQSLTVQLAKHKNTFIDLFLGEPGPDGPGYEERAAVVERSMSNFSQPAEDTTRPTTTYLLPMIEEYAKASQPLVANVWVDGDNVLRNFSLVHPFKQTDGKVRNYFSIPLGMLMTYYRVGRSDLVITPERLTIRGAKAPILDKRTKETVTHKLTVDKLKSVLDPVGNKPTDYNENLYRVLVAEFRLIYTNDADKEPYLPITLLKKGSGFTLIDGREIWDAAQAVGSKKINAVICETRDIEVKFRNGFGFPYSIPINYGARQELPYKDPVDKTIKLWHPIPTIPAKDIYTLGRLPEMPSMEGFRLPARYDQGQLKDWFIGNLIPRQVNKIKENVYRKNHKVDDELIWKYFANQNPDLGKFYLYNLFFDNVEAAGLPIGAWDALFQEFIQIPDVQNIFKSVGYTDLQDLHLTERDVVIALQNAWSDHFSRYYNKMVFTAAYTTGMATDVHQTPFGSMFGINAIIYAFSTIVTNSQITIVDTWKQILAMGLILLLLGAIYGSTNIRVGGIIFLITALGGIITAYVVFDVGSVMIKIIPITAANLVLFISLLVYKLLTEEKDKQFLKATFSSYLAPELIDQMYESKTMPKLGGEPGIRTAFFTDIQGFSTFSEKLTSEELVELLNEYLNSMTNILLAEKGTLDKYIGDAIIGIFGAPMPMEDHSIRALRVAVRMQSNLAALRDKWRSEMAPAGVNRNSKNLPPDQWEPGKKWPVIVYDMRVRVGINSGDMTTGNMGSTMRMNYTMMGDTVNTAARLEAGAKQFGVYTLVSESTLNHEFVNEQGQKVKTADLVHARFIDRITVVGKTEPVEIFEVVGIKGESDLTPEQQELFTLYNEGVKAYQATQWDKALEIFHKTKEIELFKQNKMTPSKMYIERCEEYKANPPVPPGQAWDGVYHMTQKH